MSVAQRNLARSENQPNAEVIDLGVQWDGGAPLPHVVSDGSRAILICRASDTSPGWDQLVTRGVSASDASAFPLIRFSFRGCRSIRFGSPGDEVLSGHPLWGSGLEFYEAHIVRNSAWAKEIEAIRSVHSGYRGPTETTHYLFAFHDETFEALADDVTVEAFEGSLNSALADAARSIAP